MRWSWIALALGALALAGGCGGSSGDSGNDASAEGLVSTVDIDGLGPTTALSRTNAEKLSSCTAYELTRDVSITFVSRDPDEACESWIERQSSQGESWSANPTDGKRDPACIFIVLRFGLVEVDAAESSPAVGRLCAALGSQPRWRRFSAAETAKRDSRAIPLVLDVPSPSMEPTLHCGRPTKDCTAATSDLLVIDLVPASALRRGDLVAFKAPRSARRCGGAGAKWVKRLIGLPGDRWEERHGYVYINGRKLDEPYVGPDRRDSDSITERTIAKDEYFVLGDNRVHSCDSRAWGSVPAENIIGRVSDVLRAE
jgi:signal peptidase I